MSLVWNQGNGSAATLFSRPAGQSASSKEKRTGNKPRELNVESLESRVVLSSTLFSDTFDQTAFDAANWAGVQNATIDDVGIGEPSAPYAARINGNTGTGDVLESAVIDLSGHSRVTLTYLFQRGGGGNMPESGNDLVVEFRDASGNWVEFDRKVGNGPNLNEFAHQTTLLPQEALHQNFQFRFRATGNSNAVDLDDWFLDDIEVRSVESSGGEVFSVSQTQTNTLFFPNLLTFDLTNVPTPGGDGTLTIRAVGDLSSTLENLELRAEGILLDHIFINGGVDHAESTITIVLPQSLLETLAADGTITFTLRPSSLVSNTGPSSVTLDLSYETPPVVTDTEPPVIESAELQPDNQTFVVQFEHDDLDPATVEDVANYRILRANGDANGDGDPFNDGDETEVAVQSVTFDPSTNQATVLASTVLADGLFRLVIDGDDASQDGSGGVTDLAGNHLAGGDFTADFERTVSDEKFEISDLKEATKELGLSRRWERFLTRPLNFADYLVGKQNGRTRAVIRLLKVYQFRIDFALARDKISVAEHGQLSEMTSQIIEEFRLNPIPVQECRRKWVFWHHCRRRC